MLWRLGVVVLRSAEELEGRRVPGGGKVVSGCGHHTAFHVRDCQGLINVPGRSTLAVSFEFDEHFAAYRDERLSYFHPQVVLRLHALLGSGVVGKSGLAPHLPLLWSFWQLAGDP